MYASPDPSSIGAMPPTDFITRAAEEIVKPQGPGALAQVESTIERLGKRFEWAHIKEAAYHTEYARLDAVRKELRAATTPSMPPVELEGLLEAWRTEIPLIRRELLGRLSDGLEVSDGRVVRFIPRTDREAAVTKLVDQAWPKPTPGDRGFQRTGWDLNPRGPCGPTAFPVPRPRPS